MIKTYAEQDDLVDKHKNLLDESKTQSGESISL
jgi:hypothetical protein